MRVVFDAWLDGFDAAIDAFRSWAEEFGDPATKRAIAIAADMVEASRPDYEQVVRKADEMDQP